MENKIRLLPEIVANQIAAGEVVDNPASAIKEMMENSIDAGASSVTVNFRNAGLELIQIVDDGCGMSEETVKNVTDPFYTTRTTRKVGLGLPLLKLAAEQTGGELCLTSSTQKDDHGTTLVATFNTQSIDFMPVGDIVSTICILIAGSPEIDFCFSDRSPCGEVTLDTRELKAILGEGISLAELEIQQWIAEYLKEQYQSLVK